MPALKTMLARTHVKHARIEIIPLIDVIFFLLATFVLFTLSLNRILVLDVELPESTPNPGTEMVVLRISGGDTLFWGPDMITRAELPAKLAHYKTTEVETNRRIMITSDPGVLLGAATDVLDEVRRAKDIKVTFDMRVAKTREGAP
jgi:biopolymer transport protein ExbD